MITIKETNLQDFEFWSGAKELADCLTPEELRDIESYIEDLYPDGLTETQINDLFWFEPDFISDIIGENYEDIINRTFK